MRIENAQCLINTNPEVALAILDSIDDNNLGRYKATVHYLRGKGKLNLGNYPDATSEFLNAEKYAKATDDIDALKLTLQGIIDLADSVNDLNIKVAFAAQLCNIYMRENDYNKAFQILDEVGGGYTPEIISRKYRTELENLAETLRICDTVMVATSSDKLERRSDRLYNKIKSLNNIIVFPHEIANNLQNSRLKSLIEKIGTNSDWRTEIDRNLIQMTPQKAHYIIVSLWEQGHENHARDFMTFISSRFSEQSLSEFRALFRYDIKEAARQFNHEEVLIREQIINQQRIILAVVSVLALAIVLIIGIYIRLLRVRRSQLEEQSMISAAELRSSLHDLEVENIGILGHLCDTYYENYANESAKSRTARETLKTIRQMASSDEFIARMEKHLNHVSDGIIKTLTTEFPSLKKSDRLLFLYNALGLSIPSMCIMLGERREVIYNRRVRLRSRIQESETSCKDTLLKYLQ